MKKSKIFWSGILVGLLIAVGMLLLIFMGSSAYTLFTGKSIASESLVDKDVQTKLEMLNSMMDKNFLEYSDTLDSTSRTEGMYKGLVSSLGDPYSEYFTEEEFNQELEDDSGVFGGIGVQIAENLETGRFYAEQFVGKRSPAQAAGMQEKDIFYEVDGLKVEGMSLTELVEHCRGEVDTTVELVMLRGEDEEQVKITIKRAKIESTSVTGQMEEGTTGYIRIIEFVQNTPDQFQETLDELKAAGMDRMIIDLRSNPGGDVTAVLEVADIIMDGGRIVYTKTKSEEEKDYDAEPGGIDMPIVVLVNGFSASASEILTGALKDHGLAVIMGTQTFGKGIVQGVYPLNDGSAIKITDRKYYTPSGNDIQGVGIAPDITIEFDSDAYDADGTDNQLDEAKKYIKSMK